LRFTTLDAVPATGDIRLNQGVTVAFGHAFDQNFLSSRVPASVSAATIALGVDNSNAFDFSSSGLNYSAISLGAGRCSEVRRRRSPRMIVPIASVVEGER
jgi:hypothetical protein